jgi:two-component sensor histidine kinase
LDAVFITAYLQLAAYEKALPHVISLEKQSLQPGIDAETVPIIYAALVSYYLATHQHQKAMANSLKHKAAVEKLTRPDIISLYYLLRFRVDSATGQYISAIQNFQRYKAIKDSLLTETKTRQIAQLGVLYETEKKEKDIQTLQRSAEIQQNNLRQANIRQTLTLIGAALLLIIAGLLYYGYRLKRKSNSALLRQQQEISEKNEALQSLVTEKDWLMREIHHRVKNNLHMVVGLLASQAEYTKGKEALDAINESQHRVQAMSIIHQKLYQTDNLSFTDMSEYIHELVDYLQSSFDKSVSIRFILDIAKVDFPLSLSIPIGLIINEAVTNSIKYAFPDKRNGEIHITLKEQASGHFRLGIHDNGVGVPDSFGLQKTTSLGVSLIRGLTDDIKGQLTIQNDNGVKIEITFPPVKNDENHE